VTQRNGKKAASGIAAWGENGTPLLPASLRELWGDEALPAWVVEELGLPHGATFEALGPDLWKVAPPAVAPRVRNFIVNLVTARRAEIEALKVFPSRWPPALSASSLPWANRTRNCLERSGFLADRGSLSELTYGRLLDVPSMGIVSVLDFACVSEAAMNQRVRLTQDSPDSRERDAGSGAPTGSDPLVEAIDAPWADQVSAQDPRFADLLPPGDGTVFERIEQITGQPQEDIGAERELAEAVAAIERRIEEMSRLTLDSALTQFLEALSGFHGAKLEALSARLGWSGAPPITLEEAGNMVGVSRERMRQLQKRTTDRLPQHAVYMPSLDEALELVRDQAPLDLEDASKLLRDSGLTSTEFGPESLLSAAVACGRTAPFEIERIRGRARIVTTAHQAYAGTLVSIAHRQAGASGASNIEEVLAEASAGGLDLDADTVREVLTSYSDLEFLEDDWFWYPKGKLERNRLRNVTRKMLAVASPIHVSVLREGVWREYRYRGARGLGTWPLIVPPRSVMRRFFEVHPEFTINQEGLVSPTKPLDYRLELMATEQVFVDVLRSSPACVLDRASCARGCMERGMNQNTFSVYLTYSPVIAHLGTDIWSLRGVQVDPSAVEAVRKANAARPRERRVIDHGWTEDGGLWVAVRLPSLFGRGFVFGMPGAIKRLVAGREFPASDDKGTPSGTVRVSEDGTSHGYGPFLSRRGADEADILLVEFNLAAGTSVLRLGDEELLEEWNPTL